MGITLDKLVFNAADLADSANVGAFLRASDGTLLTHTDVGGKKALDVRLAEGVNVEVDLNFADDSVTAHQGGSWSVALDAPTLAALENITVSATDLDIRDLDYTQDNIEIKDAAGDALGINADGSINTKFAPATSGAYGANSVTTTAESIIASALANRTKVIIQNLGNKDLFVGFNNSVTSANGARVSAGSSLELEAGPSLAVYGITASGSTDVRYLEVA
jgi:hypothetical protein